MVDGSDRSMEKRTVITVLPLYVIVVTDYSSHQTFPTAGGNYRCIVCSSCTYCIVVDMCSTVTPHLRPRLARVTLSLIMGVMFGIGSHEPLINKATFHGGRPVSSITLGTLARARPPDTLPRMSSSNRCHVSRNALDA